MEFPGIKGIKELRKNFDVLIFDLDGTLLDSMTTWQDVDRNFLGKRGIELTPDYTEYVKGAAIEDSAAYTVRRYRLPETPEEVMAEWNSEVDRKYHNDILLKKGAPDFLRAARKAGFKITAASSLTSGNAEACLKRNGVLPLFDSIHLLENYPSIPDKSSPDIYIQAMKSCGVENPKRALVFEDVPKAADSAGAGGFKVCLISDPIGCPDFEKIKENYDYFIIDWNS